MIPLLLALAAPAAAAAPAVEARYRICADLVRSSPDQALAYAAGWQDGGMHARQCAGLAHAALEHWPAAAEAFEAAAAEAGASAEAADFQVQAGNAWLAGGDPVKAKTAFDTALATEFLSSELRGEVHIDRARAEVASDDLPSARRDLDKAIELVPNDAFAWYMSAALARRQRDLHRAQDHIAKALALSPDDAELLLEAGTIAGLSGEVDAARGLYSRAARAAPGTDTARRALDAIANNGGENGPAPAPAPAPSPN
jgi:Tfp pilus assembly protein PilF